MDCDIRPLVARKRIALIAHDLKKGDLSALPHDRKEPGLTVILHAIEWTHETMK